MAIRSQMRLAQISGSLDSTIAVAQAADINADSLQGVMDHMASAIKRITGADNYHSSDNGQFAHAITGSHGLKFDGDLDINSNSFTANKQVTSYSQITSNRTRTSNAHVTSCLKRNSSWRTRVNN